MQRQSPPLSDQARVVPYSRFRLRLERTADPAYDRPPPCGEIAEAARLAHRVVAGEPHEVLGALLLDGQERAIGHVVAFRGSLDRAHCTPAGIFGPALLANAAQVILFHNHPSGFALPSHDDIRATQRMAKAGAILGIHLRDHLVLGEPPAFTSIAALGHLDDYSGFAASLAAAPGELAGDRRQIVKPKYRDPETGETWAGRGLMAGWLRRRIDAGARIEDFRVDDEG